MIAPIVMHHFTKQGNKELYKAYLNIKYQVFVRELSWSTLADESDKAIAREESFDEASRFLVASTDKGLPIGTVRAIFLNQGFPHQDLFEHHLRQPVFNQIIDRLCTLNALAVLPPYRRQIYRVSNQGWVGAVGRLLMLGLIRSLAQEGMKGAIVTTAGTVSTLLCAHLGFYAIDKPTFTSLQPELMTNMGIIFGSDAHIRAQEACQMNPSKPDSLDADSIKLLHYFESCQQQALGARSLESYYTGR